MAGPGLAKDNDRVTVLRASRGRPAGGRGWRPVRVPGPHDDWNRVNDLTPQAPDTPGPADAPVPAQPDAALDAHPDATSVAWHPVAVGTVAAPGVDVVVHPPVAGEPADAGATAGATATGGAAGSAGRRRARARRRWPLVAGLTAASLAVAGGAVGYNGARKTVTLDVDGAVTQVTTFAGSVEGLLEREGVRVGERDVVTPTGDAALREGAEVVVRYGRQLSLLVDGTEASAWVAALDADDALSRLAERGGDVRLVPSRSGDRASLPLRLSADGPVAVVADGRTLTAPDGSADVDAVLDAVDVDIDADDRVTVADAPAAGVQGAGAPDVAVVVQRVETRDVATETPVPFATVEREDPERYADLRPKVVQEGVEGVHTRVERITTVDGVEESRTLVSEADTTPPVEKIVVKGTKERPEPEPDRKSVV